MIFLIKLSCIRVVFARFSDLSCTYSLRLDCFLRVVFCTLAVLDTLLPLSIAMVTYSLSYAVSKLLSSTKFGFCRINLSLLSLSIQILFHLNTDFLVSKVRVELSHYCVETYRMLFYIVCSFFQGMVFFCVLLFSMLQICLAFFMRA